MDALEAMANAVIGLFISWAATWLVLGYSPGESVAVSTMFFWLSFSRAWLIRAIFRGLVNG